MNNSFLKEENMAISSLLQNLQNNQESSNNRLSLDSIFDEDLEVLLPEKYGIFPDTNDTSYLGKILSYLGRIDFIDKNYSPKFLLGSSRLAALKFYGKDAIWKDSLETDDVIDIASNKKVVFGDLDIDVAFKTNKQNIVNAINKLDPITFFAKVHTEIHIAIRIGSKVIQVDLVDISKNSDALPFLQKSSFLDLSNNIKGVFSIALLRAVINNMDISKENTISSILSFANSNKQSDFSQNLFNKMNNGFIPSKIKFSLGNDGLRLVLVLKKENREEKINLDLDPRVDYKNLNILAQTILQNKNATASDIFHASKLAEFIKNNKQDKINFIWNDFLKYCEEKVKAGISEKEFKLGIEAIKNLLGLNKNNSISIKTTPQKTLFEGKQSIGRFLGTNEFGNITIFEILKTLVQETNNQGKENFYLNLATTPNIDLVEKVDALYCSFGIDRSGLFFMESSNSGPVYERTVNKKFGFNKDLLSSFKYLSKDNKFQIILKKIFSLMGAFKYEAELFPVLTHQGDEQNNIIFVATKYKRNKFGKFGAFVVFKSLLWNDTSFSWYRPEQNINETMLKTLKSNGEQNKNNWKIYTNDEDMKIDATILVNLGATLSSYLSSEHLFQIGLSILKSRSRQNERQQLVNELDKVKKQFQDTLDEYANNTPSRLGNKLTPVEGVILRIKASNGDIYEIKGTSEVFKAQKELLWEDRTNILNIENDFEEQIIKNVLSLNLSSGWRAQLNSIIKRIAETFEPISDNPKNEFIEFLIPYVVQKEIDYETIKSRLIFLLEEFEGEYSEFLEHFKQHKIHFDIDTIRKTKEYFTAFKNKFDKIKNLIHSPLQGIPFYKRIFGEVLGTRIDKIINFDFIEQENNENESRPKVIIWNGRAQPWHKGHDMMIQKGKTFLDALGADKILIMIIKGQDHLTNNEQNPLNEKEQLALIYSLYKNDPKVEIYNKFPKSSFIKDIADHVYSTR